MPEPDDEMITFRISPKDRAAIQRIVEAGEFRNRSDFLRYAVRSTLDSIHHRNALPRPGNLELEGVELPSQQTAPGARNRPRAGQRKGAGL